MFVVGQCALIIELRPNAVVAVTSNGAKQAAYNARHDQNLGQVYTCIGCETP